MKSPKPPVAPEAPPKLDKMAARKEKLEVERIVLFEKWKAALEATGGNVTHAALAEFPERAPKNARDHGNYLTKRLGLLEFAAALRRATTGKDTGRPRK